MKYCHIIWDFDGTLFDSYPALASAFQQALRMQGIAEPLDEILTQMKQSMGQAHRFYREKYQLEPDFFARYEALRIPAEEEGTRPFPGIVRLCKNIVSAGGRNYLFTHRGKTTEYFMEKYDLMSSFSELITSQEGFPRKPDPTGILHLMQAHHFPANSAVMIGDRDLDLLAGKNAGIAACYFAENDHHTDYADWQVSSAAELRDFLFDQ